MPTIHLSKRHALLASLIVVVVAAVTVGYASSSGLLMETRFEFFSSTDASARITGKATTAAPVITNVSLSAVTDTTATVSWVTNIPADSRLRVWVDKPYGLSFTDVAKVTTHSLTATGLQPNTRYGYVVRSSANGKLTTSPIGTFTTTSLPVPTPTPTAVSSADGAPVVRSFTANPQTIAPGESVTITWDVVDATDIVVDGGIGDVTGWQTFAEKSPSTTTTYTLTATNAKGVTTAQVTVNVSDTVASPSVAPSSTPGPVSSPSPTPTPIITPLSTPTPTPTPTPPSTPSPSAAPTWMAPLPPQSGGTTYYVAPNGSDSNPGTYTAPFKTIQKGADMVNPGDTVVVRDGIYTGVTTEGNLPCYTAGDKEHVCPYRGGTANNWVVIRSEHRWGAVIDGQNGVLASGFSIGGGASYLRIEGFEIRNIAANASAGAIQTYNGAHDLQFVGNNIHDIGHVCSDTSNGQVGIYGKSNNVLIEGNWIHVVGRFSPGENGCSPTNTNYMNHDHGIYWDGQPSGLTIRNNIFQTIKHGWSIQLWNGTISNVNIVNNTFFDGNDQYKDGSYFVFWTGTHNNYVIKNNIFGKSRTGIVDTQTYNTTFNNCVFDNNLLMPTVSGGTPVVLDSAINGTFTIGSSNQIGVDPKFANAATGDFHLQTGSPAIDRGASIVGLSYDYDGNVRPIGAGFDIGAYER